MTLYLLNYCNYFNRLVRKEETLEAYRPYMIDGSGIPNINFVPGDGVTTTQIVNWNLDDPDYVLVVDDYGDIVSRWFVMHSERTRAGQYLLNLRRDIMADFRDNVTESVAYVRRASTLPDYARKLIYNSEGMSFNQIKTREDLLYDKTKTPWIVGYVDPTAQNLQGATIDFEGNNAPLRNYQEIKDFEAAPKCVLDRTINVLVTATAPGTSPLGGATTYAYEYLVTPSIGGSSTAGASLNSRTQSSNLGWYTQNSTDTDAIVTALKRTFNGKREAIAAAISRNISASTASSDKKLYATNPLDGLQGRVVLDTDTGLFYEINIEPTQYSSTFNTTVNDQSDYPDVFNTINPSVLETGFFNKNLSSTKMVIQYSWTVYTLYLNQVSYGSYSVTLHDTARVLRDAPYRMFCMKYTPKNYMLAINLATNNGIKVYDVQLLPYCPVQDYFNDDGSYTNISTLISGTDYEYIYDKPEGTPGAVILDRLFWATVSTDTFDIDYIVDVPDIKQAIECDLYRLCSPNGNGQFEFNAARNGGVLKINVDYTYRPYDPYIHLNPNFGELYGRDFNDFRGLILNGDFSIPKINDQWVDYTTQNKNYQNIFNREIQSLELQHKLQRRQDLFNATVGTVQGGATGAIAGSLAGPWGAVAGAAIGTTASAIGGALDLQMNQQLRADQMDMRKDMFSYNLQNIQAIPQSVSKTGCLTNNNKLVPYVEYYTCTDDEKTVFAEKIKYTGMTVGATGNVGDFVIIGAGIENPQYIEADIIKIDIKEDYHIAMEIANELRQGVRFT